MKQNDSPSKNWEPCDFGVIQETAIQSGGSPRRMVRLLGAGFLLIIACTLFSHSLSDPGSSAGIPTEIDCVQVKQNLVSYASKQISDKDMSRRIRFHLMNCKGCNIKYSNVQCRLDPKCRDKIGKSTVLKPCSENKAP